MPWLLGLASVAEKVLGPATFNLLTPFIPGGVLVVGGMAIRSDWRNLISGIPKIFGEATLLVLVIFAVYVAGLVLIYVVNAASELVGYSLGYALAAKLAVDPLGMLQSKDETWRRTASVFLGNDLAPTSIETGMDAAIYDSWFQTLQNIQDPNLRFAKMNELFDKYTSGRKIDWSWQQWFWALDQYFPRPPQGLRADYDLSICVQSCGWAGIVLLSYAPSTHWLLWLVFIAAAIYGIVRQFIVALSVTSGNYGTGFQLASMLREIRSRR